MKLMLRGFFSLLLLASGLAILDARADNNNDGCETKSFCPEINCDDDCSGDVFGKTHFSLRPQDSNGARKLVGVKDKIHLFGKEEFYGVASIGLQYGQTFNRENQLGKYFSFVQGNHCMTYGDACDGTFDIFGVNFGTTGSGTICFDPIIKNFVADFDLWVGWDEFVCGLWTRIGIPVNHTRWDLRLCDTNTGDGRSTFTPGEVDLLATATTGSEVPFTNLKAAFVGNKGFGDAPPLKCGKVCGQQKDTQVAGLNIAIGYDFIRRERGHLAAGVKFVAPTGTRPTDEFLFNAVSGSQHMWQLGATIDAGYRLWENCDGDQRLAAYFDADIMHLFSAKQSRLFGLKIDGKTSPGSSYLLLKKFDDSGTAIGLERAANVLCCCAKIEAAVMADLTLMLQYDCGCFSTGLGWNFWVRSKEKIKSVEGCDLASQNVGIKGDSPLSDVVGGFSTPNNNTQSLSTIGRCAPDDATTVLLTNDDIDYCPALHPRAFSNKIFGFVGYNWRDCDWQPYVLVEGGVEFGQDNRAADQWEVMLKGGISF